MAAIKFYYRKRPPLPNAFLLAEDRVEVPDFIPGQCMCKACHSRTLEFVPYVDDAKCRECGQYQNEEINLV